MSVSGTDFRGNLREYEWLPDVSYNCLYCGCLPVHHKKLDTKALPIISDQSLNETESAGSSKENISKRSSESNESYENNFFPQVVQESNILPSASHTLKTQVNFISRQRHNCIQCEQQVTLEFFIPDVFRPNLMKSINSGLINYKEQSEIIRTVASNMI
ncbi:uncharacterized protein LOC122504780 isoform X2 [Leptopilina heterotoma]|uniref:uncharacterized protein LOC122504780 isoform X2 n=1 Tax=Leptopilina heterotoma TaxID=63436 RepID=UPI001CA899B1|nr:uncharacterized protein LOC122504780 isoform X2 [Leptopilina heterotoma]